MDDLEVKSVRLNKKQAGLIKKFVKENLNGATGAGRVLNVSRQTYDGYVLMRRKMPIYHGKALFEALERPPELCFLASDETYTERYLKRSCDRAGLEVDLRFIRTGEHSKGLENYWVEGYRSAARSVTDAFCGSDKELREKLVHELVSLIEANGINLGEILSKLLRLHYRAFRQANAAEKVNILEGLIRITR